MKTVIHWFRRDLRVADNTSLALAASRAEHVIPVYVISDWRGEHGWTGAPRQEFLCGCLLALAGNIAALGGNLIFRRGRAEDELARLARETGASAIFYNRDPDPFGRQVEARIQAMADASGIGVIASKDVCIHERDEVRTATGEPYRVFTPYWKAWDRLPKPTAGGRIKALRTPAAIASLPPPDPATWGFVSGGTRAPESGECAARSRLKTFLEHGIADYGQKRDLLAEVGTSGLSPDLRFGLLSPREVFVRAGERANELDADGRSGAGKFISELVWREFYMQVLWHHPRVLEEEFNPAFRGMGWPGSEDAFLRWCRGETGFPIVDAGMRQLNATGLMHNRARMITAMFLTKDLHVDWRRGEMYFMRRLIDGEIASNNGGWQWSAGTGADAAPYFRIQNPWTQTKRYDPDGRYIKRWIPELRDSHPGRFLEPPRDGKPIAAGYPAPMVDHPVERDRALDLFAAARGR